MFRKACLAVHPDKQMGKENENLSKLIFMELNEVNKNMHAGLMAELFYRKEIMVELQTCTKSDYLLKSI